MANRSGTMVVLACHGVYDPQTQEFYGEHPEDRPVYESHVSYAFNHLQWRSSVNPRLVISGGETKRQRRWSESRSYLELARDMGLTPPKGLILEEYALTSIDNLLLSIYMYHIMTGHYPETIDIISWEFKRERFEKTMEAINQWSSLPESWDDINFFPVGDLWDKPRKVALKDEELFIDDLRQGLDAYYNSSKTQQVISERDVYSSRTVARSVYSQFPLPF